MGLGPFRELREETAYNDPDRSMILDPSRDMPTRLRAQSKPEQRGSASVNRLPNPDPENFQIKRVEETGRYLGALVLYPDCDNFEGEKILVFEGIDEPTLREQTELDPHFAETGPIIARFKPDDHGWEHALLFMQMLSPDA